MSVALVNPYCSLQQLKDELKVKSSDTANDDHLNDSINQAARWVDRYTGRRFYFVDSLVSPLVLDEFDRVYDEIVFLQHRPIRSIASAVLGTTALTEGTDFRVRSSLTDPAPGAIDQLIRLGGNWNLNRQAGQLLTIKGQFGYSQAASYAFAVAGNGGSQLSGVTLTGWTRAQAYWRIYFSTPNYGLDLATDAAFENLIASGVRGTATGAVTLSAVGGSGVAGTASIFHNADDADAANIITPNAVTVTTAQVPSDLPQEIVKAAVLVAAAFSGQNRKEVAGLDGSQTQILDNAIPKTVYDMLGRRSPILT